MGCVESAGKIRHFLISITVKVAVFSTQRRSKPIIEHPVVKKRRKRGTVLYAYKYLKLTVVQNALAVEKLSMCS